MVRSREEQGIIALHRYDIGILFPCSLLRTSKRMILHNRKLFDFCQVVKSSRQRQVKANEAGYPDITTSEPWGFQIFTNGAPQSRSQGPQIRSLYTILEALNAIHALHYDQHAHI